MIYIPTMIHMLSALAIIFSFPTICLWNDPNLGFCLLGMGIATHITMGWFFHDVPVVPSDEDQDNHPPM